MGAQSRSYPHGVPKVSTFTHHNKLTSRIVSKPLMGLTTLNQALIRTPTVTNFIQSYLHQIFDDSHSLKASLKPLRRPFDRCQSRLKAINIGWDIKQINW